MEANVATLEAVRTNGFLSTLSAEGRSAEITVADDIYGWLIGSWDLEVIRYWVDMSGSGVKAEAHFGWVLEGRAVQDTWIMPRPSDRTGEIDKNANMYGTTLRVWDPSIQAWRVTYVNAVNNGRVELVARRVGDDIVQIGTYPNGTPVRWRFVDITPNSFRWIGESLEPDGVTWRVDGEFVGKRMG
jgi:hypothetical protein